MIDRLLRALGDLGLRPTGEEIADAIWLASHTGPEPPPAEPPETAPPIQTPPATPPGTAAPAVPPPGTAPAEPSPGRVALPVRAPDPGLFATAGMPSAGALARAFRPLRDAGTGARRILLDERALSPAAPHLFLPETPTVRERAFDLALVVDTGTSMDLWRPAMRWLRSVIEHLGVFRDIRTWTVDTDRAIGGGWPTLGTGGGASGRRPGEVVMPARRQCVLVLSDCVGAAWRTGAMQRMLGEWGRRQTVAIVQVLPQRLWRRTALELTSVRWQRVSPAGRSNDRLICRDRADGTAPRGVPIPVLELQPRWLNSWATVISGTGTGWVNGLAHVISDRVDPVTEDADEAGAGAGREAEPSPSERVARFLAVSSPEAGSLARYFAAAVLTLPVMRLVQAEMAPHSTNGHLAEVFLGGLLLRQDDAGRARSPDSVRYDFRPGVREVLVGHLTRTEATRVLGLLADVSSSQRALLDDSSNMGFAIVNRMVLQSLRGAGTPVRQRRPARVPDAAPGTAPDGTPGDTPGDAPGDARGDVPRQAPAWPPRARRVSPIWGAVPSANPRFTGREPMLAKLRAKLEAGGSALLTCTLHGMGGVGKTQLAIEYAHRYGDDYDLVWWVPAQQRAGVRASLTELAHRLGPDGGAPPGADTTGGEPWSRALAALRSGEPCGHWLMVYDNADRPEELGELLPEGPGHLLVTSRNPVWSLRTDAIDVGVLTPEESVRLLRRHLPAERGLSDADAARMAQAAGGLPIALVQAAEWQASTSMPIDEHLRRFEDVLPSMLSDDLPPGYPVSLYATWQMAIDRLRADNPAAVELLELCALFAPEPIPLAMLTTDADTVLPSALGGTLGDSVAFDLALRDLRRFALARVDAARRTVEVHRLIQAVVRRKESMSPLRRVGLAHAVHLLLLRHAPADPADPDNWPRFKEIQPHLLPSEAYDCDLPEVRGLVLSQVRYLQASGDRRSARELGEPARLRWTGMYGKDHPDVQAMTRQLSA
ncbi:FxSxx-COOH system tetratricopeptide repeat protein [Actinomadura decatromicini]|uniref:DUF7779 domain-containing protein n=1 Tax=Actinomadura decatromicini TaxID=2604572 RepID=A0A5D3FFV8_9ACTN|nr:FxSxx-COOH system tetratricopeptide repeat protein [Actinomadura decatromicini]TYK46710.1 hypothetical protein FXF68_22935 [Actinomadura decatromicini]